MIVEIWEEIFWVCGVPGFTLMLLLHCCPLWTILLLLLLLASAIKTRNWSTTQ